MATSEQKKSFSAYDFEHDSKWLQYKQNLEIPVGRNRDDVLFKYKQKYYKANVVSCINTIFCDLQGRRQPVQSCVFCWCESLLRICLQCLRQTGLMPYAGLNTSIAGLLVESIPWSRLLQCALSAKSGLDASIGSLDFIFSCFL
jgi:hypothetical protein